MQIEVSYLTRKEDLQKTIQKIEESSADYIHVDIMDGQFVPKQTEPMEEVYQVLMHHKKPLDVHLMTYHVEEWANKLKPLKPDYITFHIEAETNPNAIIRKLKQFTKVGIAINPETNLVKIAPFLNDIDQILVMSVKPGKGGQSFKKESLEKIEKLKELKREYGFTYIINVDGGITDETASLVRQSGANFCVSGAFITTSEYFEEQIKKVRG